jgi:hypothetical protein
METPAKLARVAEEAENLRLLWQQNKEHYEHQEAKFVLLLKTTKIDLKATEIKYCINNDTNLYNTRLQLVLDESNYRKKEVEIKVLEEELRACKMLARIRISEWEGQIEGGKNGLD